MKTKFNGILTLLLAFVVQISFAQEKTITGTVVDETNMPLPGATVLIKGTTTGASTDFDGKYSISANVGDVLTFSYVGYADQSSTVGTSNKIDVSMALDSSLEEVIIEAYTGATSKEKSTTAVATISAKKIESRANASLIQSLEGQVAGLNIGTGNGQPGSNSTIVIRGQTSINGNIEPLFIIDGIPVDEDNFRSINQADVANVSVLKDAAATALYGNRGAAGVIIMTTKRGKQSSGIKVQYNTQTGVTVLAAPKFDMMSSLQKINHLKSQGIAFTDTSDSEIAAIAKQSNTNWADAILRQGITQSHNLSVSTGTERTNSYTSLGMFKQEGVVRGSDLKRFNIRNNFNGKSKNDKFDFGTTVAVGYSEANDLDVENAGNNSNSGNPFFVGYIGLPYNSPYNPDGSPNILGNGTTSINNSEYNYQNSVVYESNVEEELKMLGSLNMSYKITDNIKAGTRIGIDYTQITGKSIVDPRGLRGSEIVNDGNAANQGFQGESFFRDSRFSSLAFLGYNKVFKEKHTLDLNLYTEYNHSFTNSFSYGQSGLNPLLVGYGSAFVEGTTTEDLNGDGIISVTEAQLYAPTVGSGKIQVSNFAYFGIAKYDYDAKYGFQGTLRRDASSRFTGDNKWGTFYSVSGYWNLSNESFMSNSTFNKLKLRASYGSTGNERFSGTYYGGFNDYLNLYSQGTGYNNSVSIGPAQIANENLKWETTYQANVGIDFGIKNNKLSGSLDLYNKDTQDLFLDTPQSNITHTSSVVSNIGRLRNRGVELNLRYNIFKTDDFSFSVFATGSYNQNELRELNGTDIIEGNTTALSVGSAADSFYMVRWAGVNPANGNPLYYDINGDLTETYDVSDRVLKDKSAAPVYQGGFGFNTNYKGFSLDTQFSWAAEYYRVNAELAVIEDPSIVNSTNWNASTTILNAWQQPGDITDIPALNASSTRLFSTDRYLEDASYLRLKNISIGYNFSRVIKDSWAISGVKVYLQAENLFTLSKYRGFAPEPDYLTRTFFAYPNPQIYTFGLDINF